MSKNLKKGDDASWNTSQGKTHGKVVKKQTSDTHIKGHEVKISRSDPQLIVESDKTGKRAAHKQDAVKKVP